MEIEDAQTSGVKARQQVKLKQGLEQPDAKAIVKLLKESKLKVQPAIQGDKVRVTGKKRDDLQQAIALLKGEDGPDLPLQYDNFRE